MSTLTGRRHRRRKLKSEINVVPYIDVMLVLLVIFMITAPLLNVGVDVDLPNSNAKSLRQKSDPIVVQVYEDGRYALTVKTGDKQEVTDRQLVARLAGIVANAPDTTVLVGADGKASYQQVSDAIDLLKEAKVDKVSLLSTPKAKR